MIEDCAGLIVWISRRVGRFRATSGEIAKMEASRVKSDEVSRSRPSPPEFFRVTLNLGTPRILNKVSTTLRVARISLEFFLRIFSRKILLNLIRIVSLRGLLVWFNSIHRYCSIWCWNKSSNRTITMKWIGKIGSQQFRKRYNRATKEGTSTNDKKRKNTHNRSNRVWNRRQFRKIGIASKARTMSSWWRRSKKKERKLINTYVSIKLKQCSLLTIKRSVLWATIYTLYHITRTTSKFPLCLGHANFQFYRSLNFHDRAR